jgi:light-regulated signal transduction histidine kinase (bacteriophytochrome)
MKIPTQFDSGGNHDEECQSSFDGMSKEQLVQQCEDFQRQLEATQQELAKRNAQYQEYVNTLSHDLGAPLRAISGFSDFLREEYQDQLSETANRYISYIVDGVERMRSRVLGLATLSRVTTRQSRFELTNLNEVFDDVRASAHQAIEQTGAVVTADSLPTINGDRDQLTQLLENLIDNSLKFTGKNAPRIHVSAERKGSEWTISVSDNGMGVEPEQKESVFRVFHRLDEPESNPGAGIGLTVCRHIAERHRGRIWLESEKGSGSNVHFAIPTVAPSLQVGHGNPSAIPASLETV